MVGKGGKGDTTPLLTLTPPPPTPPAFLFFVCMCPYFCFDFGGKGVRLGVSYRHRPIVGVNPFFRNVLGESTATAPFTIVFFFFSNICRFSYFVSCGSEANGRYTRPCTYAAVLLLFFFARSRLFPTVHPCILRYVPGMYLSLIHI